MIISVIFKLIIGLLSFFVTNVRFGLPEVTFYDGFVTSLNAILSITDQVFNFAYFLLGDHLIIIAPICLSFITYKYLLFPIISTIRHFIMWRLRLVMICSPFRWVCYLIICNKTLIVSKFQFCFLFEFCD